MRRAIKAPPVVEEEPAPAIGHNAPPEPEPPPEDPIEALQVELAAGNTDLARRVLDLEEAVLGIHDANGGLVKAPRFPAKLLDGEAEERAIEMVRILQGADAQAKERHRVAKEPWLTRGRAVDGFFGRLRDRIEVVRAVVQKTLDDRMRAKRDAAREAEEQRVHQETKGTYENAPPPTPTPELTRTRSSRGAVATGTDRWDFEITDPKAVPRDYCSPDSTKIRTAVTKDGVREIAGVRIYQKFSTRVR